MNDWLAVFDAPFQALGGGAFSVVEVLELLVARTSVARRAPVRPPMVSLLLASGREVTGSPIALSQREPRTLTLATNEGRLAFVSLPVVVGLVLEDAERLGQPLPGTEIPGRLDLARRVRELGARHGLACTVEVGEDELPRLVVQSLLEPLEGALAGLLQDEEGRQAVADKVDSLVVSSGGRVRLEDRVLVVAAPTLDSVPDGAGLRAEIEALL